MVEIKKLKPNSLPCNCVLVLCSSAALKVYVWLNSLCLTCTAKASKKGLYKWANKLYTLRARQSLSSCARQTLCQERAWQSFLKEWWGFVAVMSNAWATFLDNPFFIARTQKSKAPRQPGHKATRYKTTRYGTRARYANQVFQPGMPPGTRQPGHKTTRYA